MQTPHDSQSLWCQTTMLKFPRSHLQHRLTNTRGPWGRTNLWLSINNSLYLENGRPTRQTQFLWNVNRKSYALYEWWHCRWPWVTQITHGLFYVLDLLSSLKWPRSLQIWYSGRPYIGMTNYSQIGAVIVTWPFLNFRTLIVSLEWRKLDISNMVSRQIVMVTTSICTINYPPKWVMWLVYLVNKLQ